MFLGLPAMVLDAFYDALSPRASFWITKNTKCNTKNAKKYLKGSKNRLYKLKCVNYVTLFNNSVKLWAYQFLSSFWFFIGEWTLTKRAGILF